MNPRQILDQYSLECQGAAVDLGGAGGGFSGALLWRVHAQRGDLCLRRWPREHPSPERLQFIHDVLRLVSRQGFALLPVPISTRDSGTFVSHEGHLWELSPWLPGRADKSERVSSTRLASAVRTLAEFHVRAATFPLPQPCKRSSPGIEKRHAQLGQLMAGRFTTLAEEMRHKSSIWPELGERARRLGELFTLCAAEVFALLTAAVKVVVPIQPCIRDIWRDHVLFQGDEVSGLVDFGATRPENVACDIARLVGSFVGDDVEGWHASLAAYETTRPLSADERFLVRAFDESSVLLSGVNWLEWIFREERQFANRSAVLEHVDRVLRRLERGVERTGVFRIAP